MAVDPNPLAHLWEWIEIHVGAQTEGKSYYGFWSGFGSDLGEATLVGGIIMLFRQHNCHNKGCWHLGKHTTDDGYKLCKKCIGKSKGQLTLHEVHEDHQKETNDDAQKGQAAFRRTKAH
jgi:hypothetical protein